MIYICGYDIADARRLKRVSKTLERVSERFQKSVFIFKESGKCVALDVFNRVQKLLKPEDSFFMIPIRSDNFEKILYFGKFFNFEKMNQGYIIL